MTEQQGETERPPRAHIGDSYTSWAFDLAGHEQRRLAAVLAASPDFDPVAALASEAEAHRVLYAGLDAEQQAMYRLLTDIGVLDA
jgi:hypothetical protein